MMTKRVEPQGRHSWQRRYNRLLAAGGRPTADMKRHALAKANGRCTGCNIPWRKAAKTMPAWRVQPIDFHHRKRVVDGGKTTKRNIAAVCWLCNLSERNRKSANQ
jgi:hypothetical protein